MATENFNTFLNSGLTVEALRNTKDCCGWLISIAEQANHPDAVAAARWLNHTGERAFLLLDELARQAGVVLASDSFAQVTASARNPTS